MHPGGSSGMILAGVWYVSRTGVASKPLRASSRPLLSNNLHQAEQAGKTYLPLGRRTLFHFRACAGPGQYSRTSARMGASSHT